MRAEGNCIYICTVCYTNKTHLIPRDSNGQEATAILFMNTVFTSNDDVLKLKIIFTI